MDCTCDLRCPPVPDNRRNCVYCCWGCEKATSTGCPDGDDRPDKCKEYDCKDYKFYIAYRWFPEFKVWGCTMLQEVHKDKIDSEFYTKLNAVFKPVTEVKKEKENEDCV